MLVHKVKVTLLRCFLLVNFFPLVLRVLSLLVAHITLNFSKEWRPNAANHGSSFLGLICGFFSECTLLGALLNRISWLLRVGERCASTTFDIFAYCLHCFTVLNLGSFVLDGLCDPWIVSFFLHFLYSLAKHWEPRLQCCETSLGCVSDLLLYVVGVLLFRSLVDMRTELAVILHDLLVGSLLS